ncbi:hypothetical protein GF336_02310 [Candidatus Woesearchaeota archaeon]|nr:hypothetical protein [Candidatus Woesearchaeota archaeon]
MQLLNNIKNMIETCYKVDSGIDDISDFIIGDDKLDNLKPLAINKVDTYSGEASVLSNFDVEKPLLSIYLSDPLQKRIRQRPLKLEDIETVSEEIDHAVFIAYSLDYKKPMSLMEIELQGNITKYLMMKAVVAGEEGTFPGIRKSLERQIYNNIFRARFNEKDPEINQRYENAKKLARGFIDKFKKIDEPYERKTALREFYRLSPWQKVEKIKSETGITL